MLVETEKWATRLTNAILEIEDAVLLEDRAEHGLDDNTWAGVGDERGLFMQLLGEEVDTQVSVLTSGRGGIDADNLAGTALKDQEVAKSDVVAGDGNSAGGVRGLGSESNAGAATYFNVNLFPLHNSLMVLLSMVLVTTQEMVSRLVDAISSLVETVSNGVVVVT